MNKSTIQQLVDEVIKFREDREWQKLMRLRDVAVATTLETAELLDHFKWKTEKEINAYVKRHKKEIEEETMDVLFNILLMIEGLGINVDKAFFAKMKKNEKKYPVEKVKGKNPHL